MADNDSGDIQVPFKTVNSSPKKSRIWVYSLLAAAIIGGFYYYFSRTPKIDPPANADRFVILAYTDAYWFHENYMRWLVVDWALAGFAALTAVSAVIRNSYSVRQDKQNYTSKVDIALMIMAILAVLGTTFDAKLHARQLSLQYRKGDIAMQSAKMKFEKHIADPTAEETLYKDWQDAQDALASSFVSSPFVTQAPPKDQQPKDPNSTSNPPSGVTTKTPPPTK